MTEDTSKQSSPEAEQDDYSTDSANTTHSDVEEEVIVDEVDQLRADVSDLQNRLLRTHADFDNFRKRSRQEKEDLALYATSRLIEELLPVLDTFRMAMAVQGGDIEMIKQGIDMVHRQLLSVLENQGLQELAAVGQSFDPTLHEAIMQVADTGHPSGSVVEELRKGYKLKEKVLRPAMVKVAE